MELQQGGAALSVDKSPVPAAQNHSQPQLSGLWLVISAWLCIPLGVFWDAVGLALPAQGDLSPKGRELRPHPQAVSPSYWGRGVEGCWAPS